VYLRHEKQFERRTPVQRIHFKLFFFLAKENGSLPDATDAALQAMSRSDSFQ